MTLVYRMAGRVRNKQQKLTSTLLHEHAESAASTEEPFPDRDRTANHSASGRTAPSSSNSGSSGSSGSSSSSSNSSCISSSNTGQAVSMVDDSDNEVDEEENEEKNRAALVETLVRNLVLRISFEFERSFLQQKSASLAAKLQHVVLNEVDQHFNMLDEPVIAARIELAVRTPLRVLEPLFAFRANCFCNARKPQTWRGGLLV